MTSHPLQQGPEEPTRAVVIGASAGAIDALGTVLENLPARSPLAILIVVHVPADRESLITAVFQPKCRMVVREAEDKELLQPGVIYFAPPDYHLLVERDRTISLSSEEPVLFCRPSIDILFETAAEAFGSQLTGIILTGGNADGASGLRSIAASGGKVIVQNPETAYASTMPRAALEACPQAASLTLVEIAAYLNSCSVAA